MKVDLVVDQGPFGASLKKCCLGIAIFYLVCIIIGFIGSPSSYAYSSSIIGFVIGLIGNIALLFAAILENRWLALVWLVQAAVFFITWPIAFLGVIFHFGGFREAAFFDNIFLVLFEYIVILVLYLILTRIVYSYYCQLRNQQANPQHSVVI